MVQKKIDYYLMMSMGLFFFALLILINYFVGPFSDESFPIATSLRFVQGQTPFIDDHSPYISLGLLLYPFIKLSLWIHDGNNELVLFLRNTYIIFVFLVSGYTYFLIRKKLPFILSFVIVLGISTFHPFGINNFHYDTLATLLWSNILFQFYSFQFIESVKKSHLIIFSLLNLMLCFAYPAFLFLLIFFYLIFSPYSHHAKKVFLSHTLISCLATLSMIWIVFYYFDVSINNIKSFLSVVYSHKSSPYENIFAKFIELIRQLTLKYWSDLLIASSVLLIAYYGRKFWFILLVCFSFILGFPFLKINIQQATYIDTFYVLNYMGFLSFPLFLIFLRNDPEARKLFYFIGLPSLAAGTLTSLASYNLALNFIIGFFPAVILAYLFIFFIFQKNLLLKTSLNFLATRIILVFGLVELAFFQWNYIYGSPSAGIAMYKYSTKMEMQGPFQGLYVNSASHALITDLQKDIQKLDASLAKQFVYFGQFSAGYLFPNYLKPGDCFLYDYKQDHFGEKIKTPNYVFDFSKFWQTPPEDINKYLKGVHYQKIATRQFYDIYASEHTLHSESKKKS